MVTEIEHSKALNKKGWSILLRKAGPASILTIGLLIYYKHCELHERARARTFYNKSKLFGNAKIPQYE